MLAIGRRKDAFTLIELLVVIAIIAVLAAILFPVFTMAKESGRKASCQQNMKQIGAAYGLYLSDWNTTLPSSILQNPKRSTTMWDITLFYYFAAERGVLPPLPGDQMSSWAELFYRYLSSTKILYCPSDADARYNSNAYSNYWTIRVSYWWKAAADAAWINLGCRKETDFAFPSKQVLFYEHNGWHWGQQGMNLLNGVRINCAFVDGHISPRTIRDSMFNLQHIMNPAPTVGEPAWYNYRIGALRTYKLALYDPRIYFDKLPP